MADFAHVKKVWMVMVASVILTGCSRFGIGVGEQGALQVTSNNAFNVYLGDEFLGQTPFFDEKIGVGEYTLRLVPSGDEGEGVWQSKIKISKRALSVAHYESAVDLQEATSEVLELEKLANKKAVELTLSSVPDNVVVKLDGELQGFSPIVFDDIAVGDHVIGLEAPGYKAKTINVKTNQGQRLRVIAHLARDLSLKLKDPIESAVASESGKVEGEDGSGAGRVEDGVIVGVENKGSIESPYVEVLATGLGWLRVRSEPIGFGDNEVARIKVGTFFTFVEESENEEWMKVEYQSGKEGWVSGRYVRLSE